MTNLQALHHIIIRDGARSRNPHAPWTYVLTCANDTLAAMVAGAPKYMLDDAQFEPISETEAGQILRML